MSRPALLAGALVVAALAGPATANAGSLQSLGIYDAPANARGDLLVQAGGRVHILTDALREVGSLPVRQGCSPVTSVSSAVLFSCAADGRFLPLVSDVSSGVTTPGAPSLANVQPGDGFDQLGTAWLGGSNCPSVTRLPPSQDCYVVYLNRRTGEVRRMKATARARDVNADGLAASPGCAPAIAPQWGGSGVRVTSGGPSRRWLYIESCRTGSRRLLSRCPQRCTEQQVRDGVVTWLGGTTATAYVLRTRKRSTWSIPRAAASRQFLPSVMHIRRRLVLSVAQSAQRWQVYTARIT